MSDQILEKVTALVTRNQGKRTELLLFRHPTAGIQIPAGTVELSENPDDAVLREAEEETGIAGLNLLRYIGSAEESLKDNERVVVERTDVYSRPDVGSFNWAYFRRGLSVVIQREEKDFTQVAYEEWDRFPNPQFVTYGITGWVPNQCLARKKVRHFYHLTADSEKRQSWNQKDEYHVFKVFWASFADLPSIVSPQDQWLPFVRDTLGYQLESR